MALTGLALLAGASPARAAESGTTTASSPADGLGIRLLDVPAGQTHDPRAREYITESAAPGSIVHRQLRITNTTGRTQNVRLYATAATISGGAFDVSRTDQNDLSGWISLDRSNAVIQNDDSVDLDVDVTIPTDASGGERYAVIWAEMRTDNGAAVRLVNRVGVRTYIDVTAEERQSPDFTVGQIESTLDSAGAPVIVAMVRNRGELAVDVSGTLALRNGPGETTAGPFAAARTVTLASGQSSRIRFPTSDDLPRGSWTATVTAKSGTTTRGASAKVTIRSAENVAQKATNVGFAAAIAIAIAFVILITAMLLWRRRQRTRIDAEGSRSG